MTAWKKKKHYHKDCFLEYKYRIYSPLDEDNCSAFSSISFPAQHGTQDTFFIAFSTPFGSSQYEPDIRGAGFSFNPNKQHHCAQPNRSTQHWVCCSSLIRFSWSDRILYSSHYVPWQHVCLLHPRSVCFFPHWLLASVSQWVVKLPQERVSLGDTTLLL